MSLFAITEYDGIILLDSMNTVCMRPLPLTAMGSPRSEYTKSSASNFKHLSGICKGQDDASKQIPLAAILFTQLVLARCISVEDKRCSSHTSKTCVWGRGLPLRSSYTDRTSFKCTRVSRWEWISVGSSKKPVLLFTTPQFLVHFHLTFPLLLSK